MRETRDISVEQYESGRRFRKIAANLEDVVFYEVGPDDRVLYVSAAYEGVYGRSPSRMRDDGMRWLDAVHPEDAREQEAARERLWLGERVDERYRIVHPDRTVRWVRDRAFPVFAPVSGAVGVVQDITEERSLEDELLHSHKMEAVGVLASGVAHDFGNLLHGIMGGTTIALAQSTSPESARAYLQRVLDACRRGSALVAQLMSFSRKEHVNAAPMSLDRLLDDTGVLLDRLLGEHIELELQPNAPAAAILADPGQIEQLLLNLAGNARAAMPGGGTLAITTEAVRLPAHGARPAGEYVRLVVRDDGTGMDAATRDRIFDSFYTTKGPGRGTGLGLSTVLDTVKSLSGHVRVHSELGRGTAFVIDFPRVSGAEVLPASPSRPTIRFRARVLLVEDDGLVRIGVRHYLEEMGFDAIVAENASDAVELAKMYEGQIDLVVCDVTLPGVQGAKLVERLRQQDKSPFEVLYISAHAPRELREKRLIGPNEPILAKPFERDALEARLSQLLPPRLRRRPSTPSLRIPGVARRPPRDDADRRRRVMIVEDNRSARLALTDHLTDEGYHVGVFGRPSEALAAAREGQRYDVSFVDMNLPEMRGDELVHRLRQLGARSEIIYMSASPDLPAGVHGRHLVKPFALSAVTEALRAALEGPTAAAV